MIMLLLNSKKGEIRSVIENMIFYNSLIMMFLIPVYHWYIPPFMALWGLLFIFYLMAKRFKIAEISSSTKMLFLLFLLFFLWQIAGMMYSDNPKEGWRNIELRLSLFVFPLVMLTPGEVLVKNRSVLLRVFALSTFLFLTFCYFYALFRSLHYLNGSFTFNPHPDYAPWLNYFYSSEFAIIQHPSYLSLFTLLSAYIAGDRFFDVSLNIRYRIVWIIISFILLISIYFLSTRAALLATVISVPIYLFRMFKMVGRKRYLGLGIALFIFVFIILALTNPRVNNYFAWRAQNEKSSFMLNEERLKIWSSFKNVLAGNFIWGVGTGDIQDKLNEEYIKQGYDEYARSNTNTHNQYAEIIIENGLLGLLFFLAIFATIFFIAVKNGDTLYFMFAIIVFVAFMFETMLNRLAGVSFFSLFAFLLLPDFQYKKIET